MSRATAPYLSPVLRRATGPALRPGGLELTRRALARAGLVSGDRVLDLGCGPGHSLAHMARELGLNVTGLDLEPRMLAEAGKAHPALGLVRAHAGAIPLASGVFSGVLAECVLSLAPDKDAALAECRRVLAPEGVLMISDLYLRLPPPGGLDPGLPGCLGGAGGRKTWEEQVRAAGFRIALWEDHSRHLRDLLAKLVWEHGSASAFWSAWCGGFSRRGSMADAAGHRPGYFLLLARRKENCLE